VLLVLTAVWIGGLLVVLWWLWRLLWEGWADNVAGRSSTGTQSKLSVALLVLVVVAVGGPLLTALVAWRMRRTRLAAVQGVLAGVLGVLSLPVLVAALRTQTDEPPPRPGPVACQESSGGDTRCPGG
jgi:hypothetical protein